MRTPLIAATAAALSALAVTVAGSAFGSGGEQEVTAIQSCLAAHGAIAPDGDEGRALKQWFAGDRTDAEKAAMKACHVDPVQGRDKPGDPPKAVVRACLAGKDALAPADGTPKIEEDHAAPPSR